MRLELLLIALIAVLIVSLSISITSNVEIKKDYSRSMENISNLEKENSFLVMNEKELKEYLKEKDTSHKRDIDSVLTLFKVKPKRLIEYQRIEVLVRDTEYIPVTIKKDSLYNYSFSRIGSCSEVYGSVRTTDSLFTLGIDSVFSNSRVYIIQSEKKTFFDWLFKRKGKVKLDIVNDSCTRANIDRITTK